LKKLVLLFKTLKIFSFDHIMVVRESEIYIRSSKDIMRGVSKAVLSKELPSYLKILICDMATGYKVYCQGAHEVRFIKNSNFNHRDINCLGLKFVLEPPRKNCWTCWPCLDFLKKFDTKLWIDRKRMELFQKSSLEQPRTKKHSYWKTRNCTAADHKKEPKL